MKLYTVKITATFTDEISMHAENEAEARQNALDFFEDKFSVTADDQDYLFNKVEIVNVSEGFFE